MTIERVDCLVIGAGVVGLAIARRLALDGREVLVLEAERAIGTGVSSRNSEVIHAGIYYPEGSLKARLCVSGRGLLYEYCAARDVPYRRLGKLIVATSAAELPALERHYRQGLANGVDDLARLGPDEALGLEPAVNCVAALWSPSTGIVDGHRLMLSLQADLEAAGGMVALGTPVIGGRVQTDGAVVRIGGEAPTTLRADLVVNAAGLGAQALSHSLDGIPASAIAPRYLAKGYYFSLAGSSPFRHLVYPLPNVAGLGIHVTLDLDGRARFGPDVSWVEEVDYGFEEGRRADFAEAIRLYYPALDESRLHPGYTGIRPKLTGPGSAAADFLILGPRQHGGRPYVSLYGIESPGLTASLAIAEHVLDMLY